LPRGASIGRYLIIERLGSGGMGVVYSAYDPDLNRRVAIKLLRSQPGALASQGRARLLREAQSMARLSHPNVVAVFDVGVAFDQVFVAMEFIEGATLGEWLVRTRRTEDILRVFVDAGQGLAAAHAAGIVHRDAYEKTMTCFRVSAKDAHRRRTSHGYSEAQDGPYSQLQLV
jgi:serine/threonine protein kinase